MWLFTRLYIHASLYGVQHEYDVFVAVVGLKIAKHDCSDIWAKLGRRQR